MTPLSEKSIVFIHPCSKQTIRDKKREHGVLYDRDLEFSAFKKWADSDPFVYEEILSEIELHGLTLCDPDTYKRHNHPFWINRMDGPELHCPCCKKFTPWPEQFSFFAKDTEVNSQVIAEAYKKVREHIRIYGLDKTNQELGLFSKRSLTDCKRDLTDTNVHAFSVYLSGVTEDDFWNFDSHGNVNIVNHGSVIDNSVYKLGFICAYCKTVHFKPSVLCFDDLTYIGRHEKITVNTEKKQIRLINIYYHAKAVANNTTGYRGIYKETHMQSHVIDLARKQIYKLPDLFIDESTGKRKTRGTFKSVLYSNEVSCLDYAFKDIRELSNKITGDITEPFCPTNTKYSDLAAFILFGNDRVDARCKTRISALLPAAGRRYHKPIRQILQEHGSYKKAVREILIHFKADPAHTSFFVDMCSQGANKVARPNEAAQLLLIYVLLCDKTKEIERSMDVIKLLYNENTFLLGEHIVRHSRFDFLKSLQSWTNYLVSPENLLSELESLLLSSLLGERISFAEKIIVPLEDLTRIPWISRQAKRKCASIDSLTKKLNNHLYDDYVKHMLTDKEAV